jgi:hypothetical protein
MLMKTTALSANRPLTDIALCAWVAQALPGDRIEYHRGFLAIDRDDGSRDRVEVQRLRRLAHRARWAADVGLVHLVQRRLGLDCFAYVAVARRKNAAPRRLQLELADAA